MKTSSMRHLSPGRGRRPRTRFQRWGRDFVGGSFQLITLTPIDVRSTRLSHVILPGGVVTSLPMMLGGTPYAAATRAREVVNPSAAGVSSPLTDTLCTPIKAVGP